VEKSRLGEGKQIFAHGYMVPMIIVTGHIETECSSITLKFLAVKYLPCAVLLLLLLLFNSHTFQSDRLVVLGTDAVGAVKVLNQEHNGSKHTRYYT